MSKVLFALGKKPVVGKDGRCAAVEAIKAQQKNIGRTLGCKSIIFYVHCKSSAYRGAVLQHLLNDAISQDQELTVLLNDIEAERIKLSNHIVIRFSALMPEEESVDFFELFRSKDASKNLDNAGFHGLEAHAFSADYTGYFNPELSKQQIKPLL